MVGLQHDEINNVNISTILDDIQNNGGTESY